LLAGPLRTAPLLPLTNQNPPTGNRLLPPPHTDFFSRFPPSLLFRRVPSQFSNGIEWEFLLFFLLSLLLSVVV